MPQLDVHIVKIGEPVPGEDARLRRTPMFARSLLDRGHRVTWWTSDWNHQKKCRRNPDVVAASSRAGIELRLLHAPGYGGNTSPQRILHHEVFAAKLIGSLDKVPHPSALWVSFPTVSVARRIHAWAAQRQIPVVFDIRDLSPDIFVAHAPRPLRPLVSALTKPVARSVGKAFANASGLVAVSDGYLEWAKTLARPFAKRDQCQAVIPLGWEPRIISAEERRSALAKLAAKGFNPGDRLTCVFSGVFGRSYDIETVIAAARLAHQRASPVEFVLAGAGDKTELVQAAAAQVPSLTYVGWLNEVELQVLLGECDVGLMSYTAEATQGLPNKVFEYLGNELPILNSLPGESKTFIEAKGAGLNYVAHDAESLLQAALGIRENPALFARMQAAARTVGSNGQLGAAGGRMADVVEEVCSRRSV